MKKIYVLDTNIPLLDPDCLKKFEDNDIVFSTITIKEIDKMKKRIDEVGKNARIFNRILGEAGVDDNLYTGVQLPTGGILRIETNYHKIVSEIENVFFEVDNDDRILAVALGMHREYLAKKKELEEKLNAEKDKNAKKYIKNELEKLKKVILVTRDNNMLLRARYFGLPAENYKNEQLTSASDMYTGWRILPVSAEILSLYYSLKGRKDSSFDVFEFNPKSPDWSYDDFNFQANEYVVLVDKDSWEDTPENREELFSQVDQAAILKYNKEKNRLYSLKSYRQELRKYNIYPINLHQKMWIDLLFDTTIPQKSVVGLAGSGKTLLALLASIIMVKDLNLYDEIVITRPTVPMEYDVGFLPGSEEDKMDPYVRGFKDNLEFITQSMHLDRGRKDEYSFDMYNIKVEAMAYMRGKNMHRKILIIDESQNSTLRSMKTMLTRIGSDSIVILAGDIGQIDHHLLDATNNGLTYAIELMKNESLAGHITLVKGERSPLSEVIANKWDANL